jgi:hypothetical protein
VTKYWATLLAAGCVFGFALGEKPASPTLRELQRGKAGIYTRINSGQVYAGLDPIVPRKRPNAYPAKKHGKAAALNALMVHPLLDAAILDVSWRQIEPKRGQYVLAPLVQEVEQWGRAGKGVVICVVLYGQGADDSHTPAWLYEEPGVRAIAFHGGGAAKGSAVRIPAVWEAGFTEKYVEPLVRALAKALDGNPHLWYVKPGFGHIGNLTAQPSKEGGPALVNAGFTPGKWGAYCRRTMKLYREAFVRTPTLVMATSLVIRDKHHDNLRKEISDLLTEFGRQGSAVIHFDLEGNVSRVAHAFGDLAGVIPDATRGTMRIGLGDDWPLWVPPTRRDQEPTKNHDDAYLNRVLDLAFGGVEGLPRIPVTILYCQLPELQASNPDGKDYHAPVAEALGRARERLKANDRAIFAGH